MRLLIEEWLKSKDSIGQSAAEVMLWGQIIIILVNVVTGAFSLHLWYHYENMDRILNLRWPARSRICIILATLWPIPQLIPQIMSTFSSISTLFYKISHGISIVMFWLLFDVVLSLVFHLYSAFEKVHLQFRETMNQRESIAIPMKTTTTMNPLLNRQFSFSASSMGEHRQSQQELSISTGNSENASSSIRSLQDQEIVNSTFALAMDHSWNRFANIYNLFSIVVFILFWTFNFIENQCTAIHCPLLSRTHGIALIRGFISSVSILVIAMKIRSESDSLGIKENWKRSGSFFLSTVVLHVILEPVMLIYRSSPLTILWIATFLHLLTMAITGIVILDLFLFPGLSAKTRRRLMDVQKERIGKATMLIDAATAFKELIECSREAIVANPSAFCNAAMLDQFIQTYEGLHLFTNFAKESFAVENVSFLEHVVQYRRRWRTWQKSLNALSSTSQVQSSGSLSNKKKYTGNRASNEAVKLGRKVMLQAKTIYSLFLKPDSPMEINIESKVLHPLREHGSKFKLDGRTATCCENRSLMLGLQPIQSLVNILIPAQSRDRQGRQSSALQFIPMRVREVLFSQSSKVSTQDSDSEHDATILTLELFDEARNQVLELCVNNLMSAFVHDPRHSSTWIKFLLREYDLQSIENILAPDQKTILQETTDKSS